MDYHRDLVGGATPEAIWHPDPVPPIAPRLKRECTYFNGMLVLYEALIDLALAAVIVGVPVAIAWALQ